MSAHVTEILATIGPASLEIMPALYAAGMSGVRINSSHGDPATHARVIAASRAANPEGYVVYDIKGPKMRLGDFPAPIPVRAGQVLVLRTDIPKPQGSDYPAVEDSAGGIPVSYETLDRCVKPGHRLFVDDGYAGLKVTGVSPGRIECVVLYGDTLRPRKGLNHPDTIIDYPYTMPADYPNLDFAARNGVNFIADSFTRSAADVRELRGRLAGTRIKIISKIENPEGVANFDEILAETDAVMIARGDLGVEMDPCELPELQKVMIAKCNRAGKPVITATQMLESMIDNPHPSRADVSDIANALYDGSDIIMLSGETSVGKYPVECVRIMRHVAELTGKTARYRERKAGINGLAVLARA
ncbi:MAG: pyruvate kinase [Spirochaetes bacterium]|nr:MAG: pyruvate kinase [Spirochaetota bacterium]